MPQTMPAIWPPERLLEEEVEGETVGEGRAAEGVSTNDLKGEKDAREGERTWDCDEEVREGKGVVLVGAEVG